MRIDSAAPDWPRPGTESLDVIGRTPGPWSEPLRLDPVSGFTTESTFNEKNLVAAKRAPVARHSFDPRFWL